MSTYLFTIPFNVAHILLQIWWICRYLYILNNHFCLFVTVDLLLWPSFFLISTYLSHQSPDWTCTNKSKCDARSRFYRKHEFIHESISKMNINWFHLQRIIFILLGFTEFTMMFAMLMLRHHICICVCVLSVLYTDSFVNWWFMLLPFKQKIEAFDIIWLLNTF